MREAGGRTKARSTTFGRPFSSRKDSNASPTPSSVIAAAASKAGLARSVSAAVFTAFWSRGVKARKACCTRLPSWPSTVSGISSGFCVTKYTPTPLERIKRTTCSIFSSNAGGASLNSRCASSKKNTSFGFSTSPTSGNCSNNSESSQSRKVEYRRGEAINLSAARILTMPLPSSVCIRSLISSIGSPKKASPPCSPSVNRLRWMAPIEAADTLPYSVVNSLACSPTCCTMARRSFRSSSSSPLSSAILNTSCSTPAWVSLRLSKRDNRIGPISEIVARTGCPCAPLTSQKAAGNFAGAQSLTPSESSLCLSLGLSTPGAARPERSPLTSAMNTGTPMLEKRSASTCSVIVLPVPVAPVIRPCRLASAGSSASSFSWCLAITSGEAISNSEMKNRGKVGV